MAKIRYGAIVFTDKDKFDNVRKFLKDKFDFVAPKKPEEVGMISTVGDLPPDTEKELLVYEEQGIGIFRCHFKPNHQYGAMLYFHYWGEERLTPEIESRDPMKNVLVALCKKLKPDVKIFDSRGRDISLEYLIS